MYNVSFPGLGIDLDINNTITIGNFTVYLYGITIAIGLILAVVYGQSLPKSIKLRMP